MSDYIITVEQFEVRSQDIRVEAGSREEAEKHVEKILAKSGWNGLFATEGDFEDSIARIRRRTLTDTLERLRNGD